MTDITTSISQLLAAQYSPFVSPLKPAANNPNLVGNAPKQFSRELLGDLKPGDTVTTQTNYTVDNKGRLQRTGTQVTVGEQLTDAAQLPITLPSNQSPAPTLASLQKPRPRLAPSDEALLFNADTLEGGNGQPKRYVDENGAEDQDGQAVQVEVLSPDVANRDAPSLASQRQQAVSNLYARNNDVVYNVEPAFAFAA